jgi:hypothetical protein
MRAMGGPIDGMFSPPGLTPDGGAMNVGNSLQANSDFATQFRKAPTSNPLSYGSRADGGMIHGYCAREEGGPVYAPSTWGTGGPNTQAQDYAAAEARIDNMKLDLAKAEANAYENPYARDVRQVQTLRAVNPELVNEDDLKRERRGIAVLGLQRQAAAKEAPKPQGPPPMAAAPKQEAAPQKKRENAFDRMQRVAAPQFVPMGTGYVPPTLLPIARESGGAVQGADVVPLYEPPGLELHQTDDGHAFFAMAPASNNGGGMAGVATATSSPVVASVPVSKTAANAPEKKMSEDELRRAAAQLEAQMRGEWGGRMAAGPAVGVARMKG